VWGVSLCRHRSRANFDPNRSAAAPHCIRSSTEIRIQGKDTDVPSIIICDRIILEVSLDSETVWPGAAKRAQLYYNQCKSLVLIWWDKALLHLERHGCQGVSKKGGGRHRHALVEIATKYKVDSGNPKGYFENKEIIPGRDRAAAFFAR
jgi:hypothetical protein